MKVYDDFELLSLGATDDLISFYHTVVKAINLKHHESLNDLFLMVSEYHKNYVETLNNPDKPTVILVDSDTVAIDYSNIKNYVFRGFIVDMLFQYTMKKGSKLYLDGNKVGLRLD